MKFKAWINEKNGGIALSAAAILGGALILILTKVQNLGMFNKGLPGAGFFPILCGVAIAVCGAANLVATLNRIKEKDPELEKTLVNETELRNFLFVAGLSLFTMAAYRYIGLLVCMFVVVLVMCRFQSRESWLKSVLVAAGTFAAFYGTFVWGLKVPMPPSMFGI